MKTTCALSYGFLRLLFLHDHRAREIDEFNNEARSQTPEVDYHDRAQAFFRLDSLTNFGIVQ